MATQYSTTSNSYSNSYYMPPASNNNKYSFAANQSSSTSNSYYPPSYSFVAAPAPVFGDDGELTVISNDTRTHARTQAVNPPREISIGGASSSQQQRLPPPPSYAPPPPPPSSYEPAQYAVRVTPPPSPSRNTYAPAVAVYSPPKAPQQQQSIKTSTASITVPSSSTRKPLAESSPNVTTSTRTSMTIYDDGAGTTSSSTSNNQISPYYGASAQLQPKEPHKTYPKQVEDMKRRRKGATVAAGVTGGIVGLAVLGPVGMVLGATGATVATRQLGKRRERKVREKIADQEIAKQSRDAPPPLAMGGSGEMS